MRILHIESGRHMYGGAGQVVYLARGLATRGVENVVTCPPDSAIAAALATPMAGLDVVEVAMGGDLDIGLTSRMRTLLGEVKPDVVHVHSRRGADTFGALAARREGIPVLLSRRVEHMERWPVLELKIRLADRVVAISRGIYDLLVGRGVNPERLSCVPDAVDVEAYGQPMPRAEFNEQFGLSSEHVVLGVVAQLTDPKGHTYLLDALPSVVEEYPTVQVIFFGKGPREGALREQVSRLGLSGVVQFAGYREDMPQLLGCLDGLVHPAISEGLGVALLEAASAGVPILTCGVGGIPEVITDGVTGLSVPPGDALELAAALKRQLANPEAAARLATAARAHVEQYFSLDTMVAGNLAEYQRLLGQPDNTQMDAANG